MKLFDSELFRKVSINAILDPGKDIPILTKQALVKASLNAISDFGTDEISHIIIKFRSWNLFFIDLIYSDFDFIPSIFIHRNGLEILTSIVNKPSGWLRAKDLYSEFFGGIINYSSDEVKKMDAEEYVLRILQSFIEKILNFKKQKIVSIDYINIKNQFLNIANNIFSIDYSKQEFGDLEKEMGTYSKNKNEQFSDDGLKKREIYSENTVKLDKNLVEDDRVKLNNIN